MKTTNIFTVLSDLLLKAMGLVTLSIIIFCLFTLVNGCNKAQLTTLKPVLYSRMHTGDKVSPWAIEVEGQGSFLRDTTIFIDDITGYVEMRYTTEVLSTVYGDPDL